MVIILMGPKGGGKSTIREYLENKGFVSVYMEALFAEFDSKQEHTPDNPSEELRNLVYSTALNRIIEQSKIKNVVFDGTGSSDRFINFLNVLKQKCLSLKVVYIDCDAQMAYRRTQLRDKDNHRPFTKEYFDDIYNKCETRKKIADQIIINNGTIEKLLTQVQEILLKS